MCLCVCGGERSLFCVCVSCGGGGVEGRVVVKKDRQLTKKTKTNLLPN